MCGICGITSLAENPLGNCVPVVEAMAQELQHRGPDDAGYYCDDSVAFGFRRLSIIDVEGGHQPVHNEDKSIWCMLNGEIYNYLELREWLEKSGHCFYTNSDTETIVHAYEHCGLEFVERLRGMFAIALWDSKSRRLVLARDRIGKKPLYYSITDDQLAFASELKALLPWPGLDRSIDLKAVYDYLRFLYVPSPRSIFSKVHKLPPGHLLVTGSKSGDYAIHRYWSFEITPRHEPSSANLIQELRHHLEDAVRYRLRSDVPLGAFLSGGIDSSAIVALMAQEHQSALPLTFSMGFADAAFDETAFARLVASHVGTRHLEETVEPVSAKVLQNIVWHLDEPFADSSAIPTYLVCQAARKHVTVVLSGDGGDELFVGYNRYRVFQWLSHLDRWPRELREAAVSILGSSTRHIMVSFPRIAERFRQVTKALEASLLPADQRPFFLNQYFEPGTLNQLLVSDMVPSTLANSDGWYDPPLGGSHLDALDLFLYLDTVVGLPDDMLTKVDRMSMAHGLEVRCPLLDQEILAFVGKIPNQLKLHRGSQKYLLKRAVADLLPPAILNRPKQGFSVPLGSWLTTVFRELVEDCLSVETVRRRGWFSAEVVVDLRDALLHDQTKTKHLVISEHQLWHRTWALLMLELWARQYLDEQYSNK